MKSISTALLLLPGCICAAQQLDTLQNLTLQTVSVTAYEDKPLQASAFNIASLRIDSLSQTGNYNLTDLMAKTPGVSMLSTGVAIAKPVIRGLYGNRVLVLLSGLKFDNQQWQEEHGLGLSDLGLSKVELIKGPMSVLYGSEAIGGVVNLIEEGKPLIDTKESDVSMRLNSNTLGGLLQAGYKVSKEQEWFRFRAGIENNADYSDGQQRRVLNSRFDGYYLKSSWGFQKNNWVSTNHFLSSFNRFGFIFNDIYDFVSPDARWSRRLNVNPAHLVLLNVLSSENKFYLSNHSKLSLNVGVQSNKRLENEGGGAISLNMHLLTVQYLAKWEKQLSGKNNLILSHLGAFEDNTNFGARKIVPDARMQEANVSLYLETTLKQHLILENGVGAGEKWVKTFFTATVNSPEKEIHPFAKFSPYYNWFSGLTYFPNAHFNLKANLATGVRIANLAELSSNGLHEGVFTYEIGNPLLKNERNIAFNMVANYSNAHWAFSVSPFYNVFYHYIYLTPTQEEWFGFPVYRYKQQNATQYGTECSLAFKPTPQWRLGAAYSGMVSKTAEGEYTPFIPAQKITPSLHYDFYPKKGDKVSVFTNADFYFAQNQTAPFEKATPAYGLWNAGASTSFQCNHKTWTIGLAGNNLLNKAYYDHLSRFKYFGLLNIGRNIALNLKVKFYGK